MDELVFSVSDFVGVFNQTLEFAYPSVVIAGELANFRVSKNRWVYFDLKDESSSVKFFGTVYNLPGPLEDGMLLQVRGQPRLHNLYGFSVNVQTMQPVGEGSIKKAAALLETKLAAEGLFDPSRKRALPYPPQRVGLIASSESAAYHDFMKILNARWGGIDIELADVQVQGERAVEQIVEAINYFNGTSGAMRFDEAQGAGEERTEPYQEYGEGALESATPQIIGAEEHFNQQADVPDVLVITRGGGSAEDLAAFSTEQVTRAVAASRIPTIVAIGHEVDISLAELAADQRASTPSNAAELLVPDKAQVAVGLQSTRTQLNQLLSGHLQDYRHEFGRQVTALNDHLKLQLKFAQDQLKGSQQLLEALNPQAILARGYVIVRSNGKVVRLAKSLKSGQRLDVQFSDSNVSVEVE